MRTADVDTSLRPEKIDDRTGKGTVYGSMEQNGTGQWRAHCVCLVKIYGPSLADGKAEGKPSSGIIWPL